MGDWTPEELATYLGTRRAEFRELGPALLDGRHRAAEAAARARQDGELETYRQARGLVLSYTDLYNDWDRTLSRWDRLEHAVGLGAWPAIPAAYLALALAVVAAAVFIFRRRSALEQALELLEAGLLTPEELERLGLEDTGWAHGLTEALKAVAIAATAYFVAGAIRSARGQ